MAKLSITSEGKAVDSDGNFWIRVVTDMGVKWVREDSYFLGLNGK